MAWDWGSTLIFAVGWLYILPTMASKMTNSGTYGLNDVGNVEQIDRGWAEKLVPYADIATLMLASGIVFVTLSKRGRIQWKPVALPLGAMVLLGALIAALDGGKLSNQSVLLLMLILAAGVVRTSIRAVATSASLLVLSIAVASTLVATVNYDAAVQTCTVKCSEVGVIFSGGTPHGNSLGLAMTLGLPFVYLIFTGKARIWMSAYVIFLVGASGSRTSLAVACLTLLVLIICRPTVTSTGLSGQWPGVAIFAALAAGATALVVPMTQTDPLFATGRGYLWSLAWNRFMERPVMGWGNEVWNNLYHAGLFGDAAAYSTHNQFVEILLMTGMVGMSLFAVAVAMLLHVGPATYRLPAAVILFTIFAAGVLERTISISLVNPLTWALICLVLVSNHTEDTALPHSAKKGASLPDWAMGRAKTGSSFG